MSGSKDEYSNGQIVAATTVGMPLLTVTLVQRFVAGAEASMSTTLGAVGGGLVLGLVLGFVIVQTRD